eukprot:gene6399-7054_t
MGNTLEALCQHRKELACFLSFVCAVVVFRVWILIIAEGDIYYEVGAALITAALLLAISLRIRRCRAMREDEDEEGPQPLIRVDGLDLSGRGLGPDALLLLPRSTWKDGQLIAHPSVDEEAGIIVGPLAANALSPGGARGGGIYQDVDEVGQGSGGNSPCSGVNILALTSCPICLADYVNDDVVLNLPCGHFFHESCGGQWLRRKADCPLCKASVRSSVHDTIVGTTGTGGSGAIYTNEENSFFIHNNIVYHSSEDIVFSTASPAVSPVLPQQQSSAVVAVTGADNQGKSFDSAHPDLNQGPSELQSLALPLSYKRAHFLRSTSFRSSLERFQAKHSESFLRQEEEKSEEFSHDQREIYDAYQTMLEELLERFAEQEEVSVQEVFQNCKDAVDGRFAPLFAEDENKWIVDMLLGYMDFQQFLEDMLQAARRMSRK